MFYGIYDIYVIYVYLWEVILVFTTRGIAFYYSSYISVMHNTCLVVIEFETITVQSVRDSLVWIEGLEAVVEDGQNEYFIVPSKSQILVVSVLIDCALDAII